MEAELRENENEKKKKQKKIHVGRIYESRVFNKKIN